MQKKVKFENPNVFDAAVNVAPRFGLNVNQFIERALKKELERVGVTWWQDMLEVNRPDPPKSGWGNK
jgi:hypothetical protein